MAVAITVPALGEQTEEAMVSSWVKTVGDEVEKGEILLQLEADKATVDVEAPVKGRLTEILAAEGEIVQAGQVVGHLEA